MKFITKMGIWNLILLKVSVLIPTFTFPRPFVSSKLKKKRRERVGHIFLKKREKEKSCWIMAVKRKQTCSSS